MKFFSEEEKAALTAKLEARRGDLILFAADKWEIACEVLGRIRLRVAEIQKLTDRIGRAEFSLGDGFPAAAVERGREQMECGASSVHPAEDGGYAAARSEKFGEVRAEAYDVVLNGVEIGGGSIRIHEPDLQAKMFEVLGVGRKRSKRSSGTF